MISMGMGFWALIFLVINGVAFVGACLLYRGAPCWMQKCTVVGVAVVMLTMTIACGLALADVWWSWHVAILALTFGYVAWLLWLFRIHWQAWQKELRAWTQSQLSPR